jgi:amino acid permease
MGDVEHGEGAPLTADLTPRPWQHATYHSIASVLGVAAVAALPYSMAYLGWAGGMILFATATATSFYSGQCLIDCQNTRRHTTYSDLADDIMGDGWSLRWVRPFQGIVFATVAISTVIALGALMGIMDEEVDGTKDISDSAWIAIAGLMLLIVSLAPSIDKSWTVSLVGTIATLVAVLLLIVGSGLAIGKNADDVSFGRPDGNSRDYVVGVMESFGIVAFAYGGHSVIPDVHHSLGHPTESASRSAMTKGWRTSYFVIAPSYLIVMCTAYAAFGSTASSLLIEDLKPVISVGIFWVLYLSSIVNVLALGAIYNQAAFVFVEDLVIMMGCCSFSEEEHQQGLFAGAEGRKHWFKKLAIRILYVGLGTFVGVAIPFFGDVAALSGAIGFTPCTFIYPLWLFNRSTLGEKAPQWKRNLHWFLMFLFTSLGICAAVGAIYSIVLNSSDYKFFS